MWLLTMIMHFHSAVPESPGAIFTEISQWRWCYVTAAVDPAVHITNASHCGRVTCFIQATSRRQQQQRSSCYYSLASVTLDHAEPCPSHTATSSIEQPCLSPQPISFYYTIQFIHRTTTQYTYGTSTLLCFRLYGTVKGVSVQLHTT